MKTRLIVMMALLLAVLSSALWLSGCSTWEGAGKDVERTGEKMQGH